MIPLLATLLGIGLVLFVHEGGHFLAARAAGVRVDVFSLGFGPRLFGFKRGDTDYRISLLPLGGYVRMRGDEDAVGGKPRAGELHAATPMWRLLIYSGGILMNFLFAFLLVPLLFTIGLPFEAPVAGLVPPGTPAWNAGMQNGDRILEIDGRDAHGFRNFATGVALSAVDSTLEIKIERDGEVHTLTVDPEYDTGRGFRRVGVAPATDILALSSGLVATAGVPESTVITHIDGISLADPLAAQVLLDRLLTGVGPVVLGALAADAAEGTEMQTWMVDLQPTIPDGAPAQLGVTMLFDTVIQARGPLADVLLPGERIIRVGGEPMEGIGTLVDAIFAHGHLPALELLAAAEGESGATRSIRRTEAQPAVGLRELAASLELGPGEVDRLAVRSAGAAYAAGLRTGDAVLRVNNTAVHDFEALRQAVLAHAESDGADAAVTLAVLKADAAANSGADIAQDFQVTLAPIPMNNLGLALAARQEIVRSDGFIDAIGMGFEEARRMTMEVMLTLKRMVSGEIDHRNLGGIISIGQVTHNFASQGLLPLLFFLCMISVNLGVLNLLPIPALDGGHILFVLIEAVRGRPVSVGVQNVFNMVGVVLVLLLIVFVTTLDINRLMQS